MCARMCVRACVCVHSQNYSSAVSSAEESVWTTAECFDSPTAPRKATQPLYLLQISPRRPPSAFHGSKLCLIRQTSQVLVRRGIALQGVREKQGRQDDMTILHVLGERLFIMRETGKAREYIYICLQLAGLLKASVGQGGGYLTEKVNVGLVTSGAATQSDGFMTDL